MGFCRSPSNAFSKDSTASEATSIAHIPIEPEETLSRFILKEKWKKPLPGGGIRYEAFLPYSRVELSVTRVRGLSDKRLWGSGRCAAIKRIRGAKPGQTETIGLHGRFDLRASSVTPPLRLETSEGPGRGPLNHVNVIDYPPEKSAQVRLAQLLAETATLVELPAEYAITPQN